MTSEQEKQLEDLTMESGASAIRALHILGAVFRARGVSREVFLVFAGECWDWNVGADEVQLLLDKPSGALQ